MARVLTAPAVRAAPNATLLWWGGVTFAGSLLLPWHRPGRDLFAFLPETTGLAVAPSSPIMVAVLVAGLAVVLLALLPRPDAARGRLAIVVSGIGSILATGYLVAAARPFSAGPVVAILGFMSVLGTGLALSGVLRVDAFLAGCILWVSVFVLAFILYPLWTVMQASVLVKGRLTLAVVVDTLTSPGFLLVNNPGTPRNETAIALWFGGIAAVLVFALLLRRGIRRAVVVGLEAGVAGAILAALYLGYGALRNSVLLAVVVGTCATIIGFAFALLAERSQLRTRRLLGPFSILPIITPPFVLGLAMIYMFGRRGFITYGVLGLSTGIFFGPIGVAVAQILAFAPIAYLVLEGVVQALDAALEEAAETLGASPWHVLRTVIWPLARPGLANAFLLVAIESLADFGNPIILGGGKGFLATEVFYAIIGRFNPNEAAVYGVVLLVMTLSIFLIQRYWLGRRSYVTVTGKPSGARARPLPKSLDYTVTGVFVFWALLTLTLYGSVFMGSVVKLWGFDYSFTLAHLRSLSPQGWSVFWTTTKLSAYAAIPSTLLGFLIGYLVTRTQFPGRSALEFSSMLSFAVPGTVMGIGYILAFNQGPLLLTGTEFIIVLAFVFRNMPVALRAGVASIHQIDRSLEEASTMLRAGSPTTLRRIVLPLVRAAILAGLVFSFVRAMTAISQVIFLITPQTNLATTQILSYVNYGTVGLAAALSWVLVLFMALVIVVLYRFTQRLGLGRVGGAPTM
jgi:iron(III) transport system permease protein